MELAGTGFSAFLIFLQQITFLLLLEMRKVLPAYLKPYNISILSHFFHNLYTFHPYMAVHILIHGCNKCNEFSFVKAMKRLVNCFSMNLFHPLLFLVDFPYMSQIAFQQPLESRCEPLSSFGLFVQVELQCSRYVIFAGEDRYPVIQWCFHSLLEVKVRFFRSFQMTL